MVLTSLYRLAWAGVGAGVWVTLSRVCCWLLNTEQKLLSSPVSRYRADAGHSYKLDCCWDTSVFMGQWRGSLALVLSGAGLLG